MVPPRHDRLMIPGPVETEPELLAPMSAPLLAHYGPAWVRLHRETLERLKRVFCTEEAEVFLMAGPGSLGLDATIGSTVGDGSPALVLSNGFFGERLAQIAASYTSRLQVHRVPGGVPLDLDRVEDLLRAEGFALVAVVHCETSTGMLNPIREIAEISHRHGALCMVDAVSSFSCVPLEVDAWGIDLCVTATQKGLACPPGLAPVAVSPAAWERIEARRSPGWYANLRIWRQYAHDWGEWHPHPSTMPSGLLQSLNLSLQYILEEGLEARFARHETMAKALREGLRDLGFELFVAEEWASPTVTAVKADDRISAGALMAHLKEVHRIQIGGGIAELHGKIFRIGHMGPQASYEMILPLLRGIEEALKAASA